MSRTGLELAYTTRTPELLKKFLCKRILVSQECLKTNLVLQMILATELANALRNENGKVTLMKIPRVMLTEITNCVFVVT